MKNDYMCPFCKGFLNVEQNICVSTKTKTGKLGLIYLNAEIGNYCFIKHPLFIVEDHEELDFFCPMCHTDLEAGDLSSDLLRILMYDARDKEEYEIIFSKIFGERCTYKKKGDKIIPFGEHQMKYMNIVKSGRK